MSQKHCLIKHFFEIQFHFGRRGQEGLQALSKSSFGIHKDEEGRSMSLLNILRKKKSQGHFNERKGDVCQNV